MNILDRIDNQIEAIKKKKIVTNEEDRNRLYLLQQLLEKAKESSLLIILTSGKNEKIKIYPDGGILLFDGAGDRETNIDEDEDEIIRLENFFSGSITSEERTLTAKILDCILRNEAKVRVVEP